MILSDIDIFEYLLRWKIMDTDWLTLTVCEVENHHFIIGDPEKQWHFFELIGIPCNRNLSIGGSYPIFEALISGNVPRKYGQKYGTGTFNVPPFNGS